MLPKIDVPIYELKLISYREPIKFRPFLVKEQKLLMMAQESMSSEENADKNYLLNTIKQIINNCVLTEIKVDDLPTFDLEYLFLNLRARSMGENVKLNFRCINEIQVENSEKTKCGNIVEIDLNLLNINPKIEKSHSNKITINEKLGLLMKYPNIHLLESIDFENQDSILKVLLSCIEAIYDEESIYYTKDVEKKELEEFIDSLPTKIIDDIKNFFETMPQIKENLEFKCSKCGYQELIEIKGLDSFFA